MGGIASVNGAICAICIELTFPGADVPSSREFPAQNREQTKAKYFPIEQGTYFSRCRELSRGWDVNFIGRSVDELAVVGARSDHRKDIGETWSVRDRLAEPANKETGERDEQNVIIGDG